MKRKRMGKSNLILVSSILIPLAVYLTFSAGMVPLDNFEKIASTSEPKPTTVQSKVRVANVEQKSDKPIFILHVGPSKTGTTTVQWFSQNFKALMEDDNVYYVGHNGHIPEQDTHRIHNLCMSGTLYDPVACKEKWEDFERILDMHHAQKHTVLLSEERFSYYHRESVENERMWNHLVPLQEKWDVRVVYTYRRYYDWLPSKYYQSFNPKGGSRYEKNLAKRVEWPDMKGKVIPTFPEYFEAYNSKWNGKHPMSMKQKYAKRFDNMWYFNMHMEGPFLPNFFCKMLPEATKICHYLKTEYTSVVKNPSTSKHLHFDMLAVEAYKRGWLNKSLARPDVAQAVEDYSSMNGYAQMADFPLDCLSPEQTDSFLQQSLSFESETVPEYFASPDGEKALREGFAASLEKHKFCTVDVEAVLNHDKWEKFFKNLRPETISAAPEK